MGGIRGRHNRVKYVPCTPAGSLVMDLVSGTEEKAWEKLLRETSHMPYKTVDDLKERGYTIEKVQT